MLAPSQITHERFFKIIIFLYYCMILIFLKNYHLKLQFNINHKSLGLLTTKTDSSQKLKTISKYHKA